MPLVRASLPSGATSGAPIRRKAFSFPLPAVTSYSATKVAARALGVRAINHERHETHEKRMLFRLYVAVTSHSATKVAARALGSERKIRKPLSVLHGEGLLCGGRGLMGYGNTVIDGSATHWRYSSV